LKHEVLLALIINFVVFWDVILKMETAVSSVHFYQTICCHIPEDCKLRLTQLERTRPHIS